MNRDVDEPILGEHWKNELAYRWMIKIIVVKGAVKG